MTLAHEHKAQPSQEILEESKTFFATNIYFTHKNHNTV